MRDPFANYDSYLERPYQDAMAESDAFTDWAESEEYDLDSPTEALLAEKDYQTYLESQYDDYDGEDQEPDWDEIEAKEWAGVEYDESSIYS